MFFTIKCKYSIKFIGKYCTKMILRVTDASCWNLEQYSGRFFENLHFLLGYELENFSFFFRIWHFGVDNKQIKQLLINMLGSIDSCSSLCKWHLTLMLPIQNEAVLGIFCDYAININIFLSYSSLSAINTSLLIQKKMTKYVATISKPLHSIF